MGAPGIYLQVEQAELAQLRLDALAQLVMSHRFPSAAAPRGHARAPDAVAADGAGNGARLLLDPAVHQGKVLLAHLAAGKLRPQPAVGEIILGYDYEPAG